MVRGVPVIPVGRISSVSVVIMIVVAVVNPNIVVDVYINVTAISIATVAITRVPICSAWVAAGLTGLAPVSPSLIRCAASA